jgi:ABC-type nickel/cobalt efflux system permease component RcnA
VIISAGIVPCPGTVTIFLFTISLGIYFVGFLSAVFMSLGMSLIIFITAYLSSKVRSTASSNQTMIKLFEYGSLVFILSLGIMLLIF